MSITGLIVGFVFSVPAAGPIGILVISNALKGRLRYCNLAILGASIADFVYVFIGAYGLTRLYFLYKPAIPYILIAGMFFLIYSGYKIMGTKVDLEHLEDKNPIDKVKKKDKGAFYTGAIINFLNPMLFIGWLTSSFFALSFVAAMGLNTGGLDKIMDQNVSQINNFAGKKIENHQVLSNVYLDKLRAGKLKEQETEEKDLSNLPGYSHLIISISYAFFLSVGSIIWFFLLALIFVKFRRRINLKVINGIIFTLGILLCGTGIYFGILAAGMLMDK